jgi:hypothetical protein
MAKARRRGARSHYGYVLGISLVLLFAALLLMSVGYVIGSQHPLF